MIKVKPQKMEVLLVAKYGKGYYIYTGLSFFREFPEGVSGAYRLFANMLSIGKDNSTGLQKLKTSMDNKTTGKIPWKRLIHHRIDC